MKEGFKKNKKLRLWNLNSFHVASEGQADQILRRWLLLVYGLFNASKSDPQYYANATSSEFVPAFGAECAASFSRPRNLSEWHLCSPICFHDVRREFTTLYPYVTYTPSSEPLPDS
jgi:hypothetical protein